MRDLQHRKLYDAYSNAKRRCHDVKMAGYKNYGGKGTKFLWTDFDSFKNDMEKSYYRHLKKHGIKQTTLDRIDRFKNYCKENCRWATWHEQALNRDNSDRSWLRNCKK